jgi:rare lipoprotein A
MRHGTPSRSGLLAVAAAALLAGCASGPRAPAPGSVDRDGPHPNPPAHLDRVPDAVPRIEPLRVGGPNKPYEIGGRRGLPVADDVPMRQTGIASWYLKFDS